MKTASITFKLKESEKEKIKALAAKNDISISECVRGIINKHLAELEMCFEENKA